MAGHDVKKLEVELRSILDGTNEMLQLIYKKGYTTPRELALTSGVAEGMAAQMKTLVTVSREIVGQAR
jgi:hypothetical protein